MPKVDPQLKKELCKTEQVLRGALPRMCIDCSVAASRSLQIPAGVKFVCGHCWQRRVSAARSVVFPLNTYTCCPQLVAEVAGTAGPVVCSVCSKWFHGRCLGIDGSLLEAVQTAARWRCPECHIPGDKT
jgi:hypothetical protein